MFGHLSLASKASPSMDAPFSLSLSKIQKMEKMSPYQTTMMYKAYLTLGRGTPKRSHMTLATGMSVDLSMLDWWELQTW